MIKQEMKRQISTGKCCCCNGTFTKATMTNHLKKCKQREVTSGMPPDMQGSKTGDTKMFHLVVEGQYLHQYWMHLDVAESATLIDVDDFLREIWVECCGHMSTFTIDNVRYERDTGGVDAMWPMIFGRGAPTRSMEANLVSVLRPGLKFYYEYDFGTPTELKLKVVLAHEGKLDDSPIRILARNNPPTIPCSICGEPATHACSRCIWDNNGWLCDNCNLEHECGEEMLLPVVNSPRTGICGYTG